MFVFVFVCTRGGDEEETPLTQKLDAMAQLIAKLGFVCAALCSLWMIAEFSISKYAVKGDVICYERTYLLDSNPVSCKDWAATNGVDEYCGKLSDGVSYPACSKNIQTNCVVTLPTTSDGEEATTCSTPHMQAFELKKDVENTANFVYVCDYSISNNDVTKVNLLTTGGGHGEEAGTGLYIGYKTGEDQSCPFDGYYFFKNLLEFLVTGVTILVVAIPEGLPLAVVLSLSFTVKRMVKDYSNVKQMKACETMGSATAVCSDKTGTLTMNKMTVVRCWVPGMSTIAEVSPQSTKDNTIPSEIQAIKEDVEEAIIVSTGIDTRLNNETRKEDEEKPEGERILNGVTQQLGNKTECALLGFVRWLNKYELPKGETKANEPVAPEQKLREEKMSSKVHEYLFNSSLKMGGCVVERVDGTKRVYLKGAAEYMLDRCDKGYIYLYQTFFQFYFDV